MGEVSDVVGRNSARLPPETSPARLGEPFPNWPHYSEDEIDAVSEVLRSGKVNAWTGRSVEQFEAAFARSTGRTRAIALANGTVSLEIALRVLGIGPGDEVVVTPRSFVASASCVVHCGARPVFADIDRDSQNLTAESIERVLTPRTRALIPVHLAGWPCEMEDIVALAERHGLYIVEDCAQAHGASLRGQPLGGFGEIGSWSFCQDKIISTGGEGGALAMDSEALWSKGWTLKEHGKSVEARCRPPALRSGYRWLHESTGTNARMTSMQAAIGLRQLERLADWTARRNANARHLWARCTALPGLRCPTVPAHLVHACYLGYVFVEPETLRTGWDRDRVLHELIERDVPVSVGSCPELYRERVFVSEGLVPPHRLPIARELGETSLAFPVHPRLELAHMERIVEVLASVMTSAVR